jgi:hypothetical protein
VIAGGTAAQWLVLLLVVLGGAGLLLRCRALEKRLVALERSLGAFAELGGGESSPAGDEEILDHLLAINDGLLQETRNPVGSPKGSEG